MPIAKEPKPGQAAPSKRPAAEFRDSNLRLTIWPNTGSNGATHHTIILTRSYQSNGKWNETSSLSPLDLQRAIKLLDRADDWIFNTAARIREAEALGAAA